MNEDAKLEVMKKLIAPDVETEDVLKEVIKEAGVLILNKMHPFGYTAGTVVPERYEYLQLQLAVEIYNKRGAEGQTTHSENGISRSWPEKTRILSLVVPHVGSVVNARSTAE